MTGQESILEVQSVGSPSAVVTGNARPKLVRAAEDAPEYWIVTNYKFFQHATLAGAELEREHLRESFPGKSFRVHRVKRRLEASTSREDIAALVAALTDCRFRLWGGGPSNDPLCQHTDAAIAKAERTS